MKINDVILRTVTKIVVFIILTLSVYLFFSGHYSPGGGFIGGLVLASAIVLMYLTSDIETVHKGMPFDFKLVAALGVLIATGTGFASVIFGKDFMTQAAMKLNLPIFGETELASVVLFEAGVAMTVIGVVVTIILSISEDE
ncbi:Na(+)/H(+) antiporter subunit B [Viridibacillus sp. FSL R5-0477]|uniref:Monovalent cation/H+ antiporter subunit B n=2 Tax=Viridibacillus TaxID=496496 RepID=W4F453_9BACL|nr:MULTISPECIES: Na(+)/H(+) antiporter subunit B [Viridibacillus]ETT87540.1 monovalent cation/H+ antiporter subunit B [Viridibacillus arenosi FSL R5-213]KOO50050.1 cation:proton antiporter [Viridibacillus arvi]OMC82600.1 Na(+)/H(+) antiporter subunit B [Viridibacillus sp. FSL H8-0123]OMC87659.1 Na(+)/H(+) antiporter subunit B [Viridibacillus sp. FSL H7-0596]OMC91202.1 Na(+)/H(+) antiporter subunit B [Viridibacillus arenosi]